jgi:quercetin dioxygenase-like cupin family protein
MPVLYKATEHGGAALTGSGSEVLLDATTLNSDFCEISRVTVDAGQSHLDRTGPDEIVWFQVLRGSGNVAGREIDASSVGLAGPDCALSIAADDALELLWARLPRARRFDAALDDRAGELRVIDWSREPVLQSEHDARTRIYVATPALVGTEAIKAEIISYPPGTSAPEHHHEGAEHFQYVLSGSGTAVLEGTTCRMEAGDILYNYPNERHWFFTDPDASENFVFVEVFVPGRYKTVWVEEAKTCAWLPTGRDARGEEPVREIAYHRSGQDEGL